MRRDVTAVALIAFAGVLCVPALAEVRAVTDRQGDYTMTRVQLSGRSANVWNVARRNDTIGTLNPQGDRNGDLWPTISESNSAPYHPWVIWSRSRGHQFDLAWSRWSRDSWEPIRWVATDAERGDDMDPVIDFAQNGRAYIGWWRNERGVGRVYISLFLVDSWLEPYPVSDVGVDSRHPRIEVQSDGTLMVWFEAEGETREHLVTFADTVAITDDINPLDYSGGDSSSNVN